jgi:enoyl-CoA hydratase/carnithine racemase
MSSLWCIEEACACCRRELLATLEQLEADKAVRGVIWASGLKRDIFTAGNDLKVLLVQQQCA